MDCKTFRYDIDSGFASKNSIIEKSHTSKIFLLMSGFQFH